MEGPLRRATSASTVPLARPVMVGISPRPVPRAHTALPRAPVAFHAVPTTSTVKLQPTRVKRALMASRQAEAPTLRALSAMCAPPARRAHPDRYRRAPRASLPRLGARRARNVALIKSTPTPEQVFVRRARSGCLRRVAPRTLGPRAVSVLRGAPARTVQARRRHA